MTAVATLLGITWERSQPVQQIRLSDHAKKMATQKGIKIKDALAAANNPKSTYPSGSYPGQSRHVRDGVCAVVDTRANRVVTVYSDIVETPIRHDQDKTRQAFFTTLAPAVVPV